MSGHILDESHFKFHVECKAKIINAVNKLKHGGDFLKALGNLAFSTDKRWTANTSKNPNVAILLEILEEYKKVEHRPSRTKVIVPIIEYAIALYASDLFYVERGEWFLLQICKRAKDFEFHEAFANPDNWYPKKRYAGIDEENPNAPTIEEEYMTWYGVDPTKDNCVISYDMKRMQELIEAQRNQFGYSWAEQELEKV